ncbi:hypothetical protein PMI03_00563 [Rhizobium sp. AP16]|nr:hypothetical protein PMI03_00563 [Rhizobium sp. AP16]
MGQAAYALQNRFAPLTTVLTDGINLGLTTMLSSYYLIFFAFQIGPVARAKTALPTKAYAPHVAHGV